MSRVLVYGFETPRLWVKPLRDLTDPKSTKGYEFIRFAKLLGIELYPWQKWLAIHGLELLEDNRTFRFNTVIVQVGRQNGKTTFASILAAWWLFVQARAYKEVNPVKFKIVGVAQNLDIAREPFKQVVLWSNPNPDSDEEKAQIIPAIQAEAKQVIYTNGKESIVAKSLANYEIRAAENARGKPAARILMDELRQLKNFRPWNAVSQTTKSFYNNQLWGISNAGTETSVVLKKQYDLGVELIQSWEKQVEQEKKPVGDWLASAPDPHFALFDWSAPEGAAWNDEQGILQANPSIGHSNITVESCRADYYKMTESDYRTEVLCQWVPTVVDTYIKPAEWRAIEIPEDDVHIVKGERTVWGVDTSVDRKWTYVAAAVLTSEGLPFVTVWHAAVGSLWVVPFMKQLAEDSGNREVVVQARGAPAMEFIKPLKDAGLDVHAVEGSWFGVATGRLRDRVRDQELLVIEQDPVTVAVSGGITKSFGETDAWNRIGSAVDVSPLVAITLALYGLETMEPTVKTRSAYESGGLMII